MNPEQESLAKPIMLFLFLVIFRLCECRDTITLNNPIKDGDVLVSSGQNFALGFFSPSNSTHRYIGIWYHRVSEQTVVWVANRNSPINGTSGVLAISNHGDLVLYGRNQTIPVWSTNVSSSAPITGLKAFLREKGNLVLVQQVSDRVLGQSFDYPTDTMLPFMKLGLDRKSGLNHFLTSWKSKSDPGTDNVFYRIDPTGFPQLVLYKGSIPWWRAGPWTGQRWSGVPEMTHNYIFNVSFVNNNDEVSIVYGVTNASIISRMVLDDSGSVNQFTWNDNDRRWIGFWSASKEQCDEYGLCSPNSECNPYDTPNFVWKCLPGFEPKSPHDWYLRDGSGGCVRKQDVSTCCSGEGFVRVTRVKVPDTAMTRGAMNMSLKSCAEECIRNCSCNAYTSADERGRGCLMWHGDLVDTRVYSGVGQDIYVHVDAVELDIYIFLSTVE